MFRRFLRHKVIRDKGLLLIFPKHPLFPRLLPGTFVGNVRLSLPVRFDRAAELKPKKAGSLPDWGPFDGRSALSLTVPDVALMRELRVSLFQLRLEDLAVGSDGRNRVLLSPFGASSGRNTPSNSKFIFGPSTWLRGLIEPEPGMAVAYVDWSQQEFGIAASLSGDRAMMDAYRSGDPYLAFGKQAGRIPADGTKQTHGAERDLCKACVLGVQYGMGAASLAGRIGRPAPYAADLLRLHRQTYPSFWRWSDGAESHAMLLNRLHTVFGWTVQIGSDANPRSLRNFPCQANGAEMLRLACCLALERGVSVLAPIHDALLVEGLEWEIKDAVAETREAMAEASAVILDGFRLRSDAAIVRWPGRYMDDRGREFWSRVMALLPGRPEANRQDEGRESKQSEGDSDEGPETSFPIGLALAG